MAAAVSPSSAMAVSRILNFWILPVTVIGNSEAIFQYRGTLKWARRSRQKARSSSSVRCRASRKRDPRHELFAHAGVGYADDLRGGDRRVLEQDLLDLARVDVLTAADDHVLRTPDDVHVAVGVHRREVTGVHPAAVVDRGVGRVGVLPVARHDEVAAGGRVRPASPSARSRRSPGSTILTSTWGRTVPTVDVRRSRSSVRRVIVETGEVSVIPYAMVISVGVHLVHDPFHDFDRARRAGHDPGPQARQVKVGEPRATRASR